MKLKSLIFMALIGIAYLPIQAQAASQDECAIWLCLPGGFPSGCGAAKSAMMDRIEDRKSPLPNFSSCAVNARGGGNMSYRYGTAVWIPPVTCGNQGPFAHLCEPKPGYWDKNGNCNTVYCMRRRYVDIYIDGRPAGETYYF